MMNLGTGKTLILTSLVLVAAPFSRAAEYRIDESLSYIEVVPSTPGDANGDPTLTEGTFFADVGAVVDEASILGTSQPLKGFPFFLDTVFATVGPAPKPLTSLRTSLSGDLQLTRSNDSFVFEPGSLLDALPNPHGPFAPQLAGEDNFGASAVGPKNYPLSGLSALVGKIAVRDVRATIVAGSLTPGSPANASPWDVLLTGGFLDYAFDPNVLALLDLDPALANGTFELIDLASASPNESNDLIVQGADGTLTVPFEVNFSFVLLDTRINPNDPPLPNDSQLALRGVIVASPVGRPGDYNGDGVVDAADYTVWRDGPADPPGYGVWRDNYGAGAAGAVAVPEPTSMVLAMLMAGFAAGRRRRESDKAGEAHGCLPPRPLIEVNVHQSGHHFLVVGSSFDAASDQFLYWSPRYWPAEFQTLTAYSTPLL